MTTLENLTNPNPRIPYAVQDKTCRPVCDVCRYFLGLEHHSPLYVVRRKTVRGKKNYVYSWRCALRTKEWHMDHLPMAYYRGLDRKYRPRPMVWPADELAYKLYGVTDSAEV